MVVQAYILIQTEVGKAATVAEAIAQINGVTLAEDVTGPYDVIVRAEASNVDELGKLVVAKVQDVDGITRTLTCPSSTSERVTQRPPDGACASLPPASVVLGVAAACCAVRRRWRSPHPPSGRVRVRLRDRGCRWTVRPASVPPRPPSPTGTDPPRRRGLGRPGDRRALRVAAPRPDRPTECLDVDGVDWFAAAAQRRRRASRPSAATPPSRCSCRAPTRPSRCCCRPSPRRRGPAARARRALPADATPSSLRRRSPCAALTRGSGPRRRQRRPVRRGSASGSARRPARGSPARVAAHIRGNIESGVKPGIVLISLTTTSPVSV